MKAIYESCMVDGNDPVQGIAKVKAIVNKFGPWPLDQASWNPHNWNFKKTLNDINTILPVAAFFWLVVGLDSKHPDNYIYSVSPFNFFYITIGTVDTDACFTLDTRPL